MSTSDDDFLKLANIATNMTGTILNAKNNAAELEALHELNNHALNNKLIAEEYEKNLVQEHATELTEYNQSTKDIENAITELRLWNVTDAEIKDKINEQYKTDGMGNVAKLYTDNLKDTFIYSVEDAANRTERIQNLKKGYAENQKVMSVLDDMMDGIDVLHTHKAKAGNALGVQNVFDSLDAIDYMSKNKGIFFDEVVDPTDSTKTIQTPNYLHRAFTMPLKSSEKYGDIGMIDMTSQNLKSRGINPTTLVPYAEERRANEMSNINKDAVANIENTKNLNERNRKIAMSQNSAIISQIQNTQPSSEYSSIDSKFRTELGLIDLSTSKINKGHLAKDMMWMENISERELHKLINAQMTEVDKAIRGFAANESGGFLFFGSDISSQYTDAEKEFLTGEQGKFTPGHNINPALYWIGEQGKNGKFVKKNVIGEWYFDDAEFEATFPDWNRNKKHMDLKTYLKGHAVRTKQMQDFALIDPFTNTQTMTEKDFATFVSDAIKYKNGEYTSEEWKERIKFHTNQK